MIAHHCEIPPSSCPRSEPLFSFAVRERYENRRKKGHHRFFREWPQTRKALRVSALTIECEICWVFLIGNHLPTQHIYITDYQRLSILVGTASVLTKHRMWGQMQTLYFTALHIRVVPPLFSPFVECPLSVSTCWMIGLFRMDVTERLLNTKVMLFLEFLRFAVGFLRSDYQIGGTWFVWKSVAKPYYSFEKVFVCHKWYTSIRGRPLYPIGYNSAFYFNIIPEMV